MKVLVCLKRVPDTTTRIKIAAGGKQIDPAGVEWIISPYDEYAIAEAVKIAEANPGSEAVVVTLGPKDATKDLRTALAIGCHRAIHLVDDAWGTRDTAQVARALAAVVKAEAPDLVLCGRQAVDDDGAAVGSYLAALLGWPALTFVIGLELADGRCTARRAIEGATEVVESELPAVVTCTKGLNQPKGPQLKAIMGAKKKPLEERAPELGDPAIAVTAMEPPPERPAGRIVGEGAAAVPELLRALREEAKVL